MQRILAFILVVLSLLVPPTAAAERRVALVVGNGAYLHAPALKNPGNDAREMARTLKRLGFDVILVVDADRAGLKPALQKFALKLRGSDVALLFYAGHGLQVFSENYIVPINASIQIEFDIDLDAVPLKLILGEMANNAKTSFAFLDACRNNPFGSNLSRNMKSGSQSIAAPGLATIGARPGSFIGFATEPGKVADDGDGSHSPFTGALLKHIVDARQDATGVMMGVRRDVVEKTGGKQVPWTQESLMHRFYFVDPDIKSENDLSKRSESLASRASGDGESVRGGERSPVHVCDRMAASPVDPNAVAEGVDIDLIDFAWAAPACAEAVRQHPDEPRFRFQLARVLRASEQFDRAYLLAKSLVRTNYVPASNLLGVMTSNGEGVERDQRAAELLFRTAMNQGDKGAIINLARMMELGLGRVKNESEAARLYHRGAEQGLGRAARNLGILYRDGRGVNRSDEQAVRSFRKAIELGDISALDDLGSMFRDGRGVERNIEEALTLFRKGIAAGSSDAATSLGRLYELGEGIAKDESQAAKLYQDAVDRGNSRAMINLALMYETGRALDKDEARAVALYRRAALKGEARAMYNFARLLRYGKGATMNKVEAATWFHRSAELGDTNGMIGLANVLDDGDGIPPDGASAAEWAYKALEAGRREFAISLIEGLSAWSAEFRWQLQEKLKVAGLYDDEVDGHANVSTAVAIEKLANLTAR